MAQPPADHRIGDAALLHYTWGSIFQDTKHNQTEVWKFDKRFYTAHVAALKVGTHLLIVMGNPHSTLPQARRPPAICFRLHTLRTIHDAGLLRDTGQVGARQGQHASVNKDSSALQVPQLEEPPKWRPGLALQDGLAVTPDLVDLLRGMIQRMNVATRDLPTLASV